MTVEDSKNKGPDQAGPTLRERLEPTIGAALGWAAKNRLQAGLLAGACLISITCAGVAWLTLGAAGNVLGREATLEMALEALDSGAYLRARELAESVRRRKTLPLEGLGGPAFVLGAAACYEADDTWSKEKKNYYLLASRYPEEARDRGFPPERRAEGLFLLGRSLYLSGQIPASRRALRLALEANQRKDRESQIHYLLAEASLNDANPKLDEALRHNSRYLANRKLPADRRNQGLFQRNEILFRMGKTAECLATLAKIPPEAKNKAEAIILQGRVLIREARQLKERPGKTSDENKLAVRRKCQAAIKVLRQAQGYDTLGNRATRKAMYLIGICFLLMDDNRSALEQFSRTRTLFVDTPDTLAADLEEAELLLRSGRNSDALTAYRRVLGVIVDPENFSNRWISLDELRARMLEAYQHCADARQFEMNVRLSRLFYPLFSKVRAMQLTAQALGEWGQDLLSGAELLPPDKADRMRRKGRLQFRRAGRVYARIAKYRITTRHYLDDLWDTADCYFKGQDFHGTARVLEKYLKNETRRRHPQALVTLGEAMLSLNRSDDALSAFRECVEFHPRDAAAYRARLLASRAYVEKGDLDQAENLLRENLDGDALTPASKEWRDSLFALGHLLHVSGRYEQAIRRLEEAVQRYPDAAQTLDARYTIALSYRRGAKAARKKLESDPVEGTRAVLIKQIHESLTAALDQYKQARKMLNERRAEIELNSLQKITLENCYFSIGGTLFELGRYEEAIKAYSTATSRYQKVPEVLEAYVQIANAYRHLDKPLKARSTLEQAKMVLASMKPEAPFEKSTNYTQEQWSDLLNRLSSL